MNGKANKCIGFWIEYMTEMLAGILHVQCKTAYVLSNYWKIKIKNRAYLKVAHLKVTYWKLTCSETSDYSVLFFFFFCHGHCTMHASIRFVVCELQCIQNAIALAVIWKWVIQVIVLTNVWVNSIANKVERIWLELIIEAVKKSAPFELKSIDNLSIRPFMSTVRKQNKTTSLKNKKNASELHAYK